MIVNTNISALIAHNRLKAKDAEQAKVSQKLSSGLKITSAADNPAGLAISEKMRAQIRGLDQAERNVRDGISLFRTGDGALNEVNEMLIRIKEMAVQAANDTNTDEDREKLNGELMEILDEIDSISDKTEFNKMKILKPNQTVIISGIQGTGGLLGREGVISGRGIDSIEALDAANNLTSPALSSNDRDGFVIVGKDGVQRQYLFKLDDHLPSDFVDIIKDIYKSGVPISRDDKIEILNTLTKALNDGMKASAGQFIGVPVPNIIGAITKDGKIVLGTNTGETFKSLYCPGQSLDGSGNIGNGFLHNYLHAGLNFYSEAGDMGVNASDIDFMPDPGPNVVVGKRLLWIQTGANASQGETFEWKTLSVRESGLEGSRLTPWEAAVKTLERVDGAIGYVSDIRSKFGAYTNRLESTANSVAIASENLSISESRIRDADMAKEMMQYTKLNVLMQASTSMLAQSNQSPQNVLQLLQGK